jgi:hypothetical protein
MPPRSSRAVAVTWIVRYVEDAELRIRTFQDREVAEQFMRGLVERGADIRSWAEVRTADQPLPDFVLAAKRA